MRLSCWFNDWKENRAQKLNDKGFLEGERLGQAFIADFVKGSWMELWYEEDEELAFALIVDYLVNVTQTYPEVPHRTGDRF